MSDSNPTMTFYLTGLRNQHAVETQAIGTITERAGRMEPYPELHAQMQQEMQRSTEQAARLDDAAGQARHQRVGGQGGGDRHGRHRRGLRALASSDEVLKNVLAAVGFKAYEIGSYKVLITLAESRRRRRRRRDAGAVDEGGAGDGGLAGQPPTLDRARLSGAPDGLAVIRRTGRRPRPPSRSHVHARPVGRPCRTWFPSTTVA